MTKLVTFNACGLHKLYRHQNVLARFRNCDVIYVATLVAGDFNAHLFEPSSASDREFIEVCGALRAENFWCFPKKQKPYTYVSGEDKSTIDYTSSLEESHLCLVASVASTSHSIASCWQNSNCQSCWQNSNCQGRRQGRRCST